MGVFNYRRFRTFVRSLARSLPLLTSECLRNPSVLLPAGCHWSFISFCHSDSVGCLLICERPARPRETTSGGAMCRGNEGWSSGTRWVGRSVRSRRLSPSVCWRQWGQFAALCRGHQPAGAGGKHWLRVIKVYLIILRRPRGPSAQL